MKRRLKISFAIYGFKSDRALSEGNDSYVFKKIIFSLVFIFYFLADTPSDDFKIQLR